MRIVRLSLLLAAGALVAGSAFVTASPQASAQPTCGSGYADAIACPTRCVTTYSGVIACPKPTSNCDGSYDDPVRGQCEYYRFTLDQPTTTSPPTTSLYYRPPTSFGPLSATATAQAVLEDGVVTVALSQELLDQLDLQRRVLVEYNPIVFDGIWPGIGGVQFPFPQDRDSITITVTASLKDGGGLFLQSFDVSRSAGVLPVAAAPMATALAHTGNETTASFVLSAATLGTGFAALGTARLARRRDGQPS